MAIRMRETKQHVRFVYKQNRMINAEGVLAPSLYITAWPICINMH